MNLQNRIIFIPILTVLLLTGGLYLRLTKVTVETFSNLEDSTLHRQVERVQNSIENAIKEHAVKIVDWAQWDNTYEFMAEKNQAYIEENLNSLTLSALGFNSVLYYTPTGSLYHGVTVKDEAETTPPSPELVTSFSTMQITESKKTEGIIRLGDQLLLFSSSEILPNKGDKPARGIMVATAVLDSATLELISHQTNLEIMYSQIGNAPLPREERAALDHIKEKKNSYIKIKTEGLAYAYGAVLDVSGEPVLLFRVTDKRKIMSAGNQVRDFTIVLLALSGLAAIILLIKVIEVSAVKRINRLTLQVSDIATSKDSSKRLADTQRGRRSLIIQTAGSVLALFLIMTAILYFVFNQYFLHGFEEVEEQIMQSNLTRATRALEGRLDQIKGKTIDWAQWDDTYRFVTDKNAEYAEANLNFETLGHMNMNYVLYFDPTGQFVDGRTINVTNESVESVESTISTAVEEVKELAIVSEPLAGFIKLPSGVVLAGASPILDTNRSLPTRGTMIFTSPVNSELADLISHQTRLTLEFVPPDPSLEIASTGIERTSLDEIVGTSVIRDVRNQPALMIKVRSARQIYAQGILASKLLPFYFLAGGMICAFVTVICVFFTILLRFRSIAKGVAEVRSRGTANLRLKKSGSDEIGGLTDHINSMLAALESTQQQLEHARDEAEAANRAKSNFVAKVSHEIRTPLHGIIGLLRILDTHQTSAIGQNYVRLIQESSKTLKVIIDDILDFSKFNSGHLQITNSEFEVRPIVLNVVRNLGANVYEKKLRELLTTVDANVPHAITADPLRLKQVLTNLVGNSLKFTESGVISVRVFRDKVGTNDVLRFEVSDTGIGIPPDRLSAIFEPFTQADDSTSRQYQGTGLGLTIAKQLIDAMHGEIEVKSTLGVGSTFSFWLPLVESVVERGVVDVGDVTRPVTIVTDGNDLRDFLKTTVTNVGYKDISLKTGGAWHTKGATITEGRGVLILDGSLIERLADFERLENAVHKKEFSRYIIILSPLQLTLKERLTVLNIKDYILKPVISDEIVRALSCEVEIQVESEPVRVPILPHLNILVAEDAPVNQIIIRGLLEDAGHTVTIVGDGQQLVEAVKRNAANDGKENKEPKFDLALVDIQMPRMDGLEATRVIRAWESGSKGTVPSHLPLIALTANAFEEEHQRMRGVGMDAILTKPLEVLDLWTTLEMVIGGKGDDLPMTAPIVAKPSINLSDLPELAHDVVTEVMHDLSPAMLRGLTPVGMSEDIDLTNDHEFIASFFDLDSLFKRTGGNLKRLCLILRVFENDVKGVVASVQDAYGRSDLTETQDTLHCLKGLLTQTGCTYANKVIPPLEKACHDNNPEPLVTGISQLLVLVQVFTKCVTTLLERLETPTKSRSESTSTPKQLDA
jgi:signal transduction histidine kinase/CheY-like chemotaxis protein